MTVDELANTDRREYNGIRIGDVVQAVRIAPVVPVGFVGLAKVLAYASKDVVHLELQNGHRRDYAVDKLSIVTKVENKPEWPPVETKVYV